MTLKAFSPTLVLCSNSFTLQLSVSLLVSSASSLCHSSVSPHSTGMGTFLAEGAALFAGKSGVRTFSRHDFLPNTKLHFQQYITAIVQVGLQRIF